MCSIKNLKIRIGVADLTANIAIGVLALKDNFC